MADNKKQDNGRPATEEIAPLSYDWDIGKRRIDENTVQSTHRPPPMRPDQKDDSDGNTR